MKKLMPDLVAQIVGGVPAEPYSVHHRLDEHSTVMIANGVNLAYSEDGSFVLTSLANPGVLVVSGEIPEKNDSFSVQTYSSIWEPITLTLTRKRKHLLVSGVVSPSMAVG